MWLVTMVLSLVVTVASLFAGASQPVHQPANDPASGSTNTPVLTPLDPSVRKRIEKAASSFVRSPDGRYWDRQVYLERSRVATRFRSAGNQPTTTPDNVRAYGIAQNGTPPETYGAILSGGGPPIDVSRLQELSLHDSTNVPLWFSIGSGSLATDGAILSMLRGDTPNDNHEGIDGPFDPVSPEELAVAIKDGKVQLSRFYYKKTVERRASSERGQEEIATFSWERRKLSTGLEPKITPAPKDVAPSVPVPNPKPQVAAPDPDISKMDLPALKVRLGQLNREREKLIKLIDRDDATLLSLADQWNAAEGIQRSTIGYSMKSFQDDRAAESTKLVTVEAEIDAVTEAIERAK